MNMIILKQHVGACSSCSANAGTRLGVWTCMRLMLTLALTIATGCRSRPVPGPTYVRVLSMPERPEIAACDIEDPPTPPEELPESYDPDVWGRVSVHRRDYADALTWMHAMRSWAADTRRCIRQLGGHP